MTTTFHTHPTAAAKRDGLGSVPTGCAELFGTRTGLVAGYRGNCGGWNAFVSETHRRAGPVSMAA